MRGLVLTLGLVIASCAGPRGPTERPAPLGKRELPALRGAVLAHVHWRGKGYGSGVSRPLYRRWRRMGINSVQLNTFCYQRRMADIRLTWNDPTMSDAAVLREIRLARSFGFEVMLKPHVWMGHPAYGGNEWRNRIDYPKPDDLDRWFSQYGRFLRRQIRLAVAGGVRYFVIGTELVKLSRHQKRWRRLIAWLRRSGYRGRLGYAAEGANAMKIRFWDALDFVGVDFYYGYPRRRAALAALERFYAGKLRGHLRHARRVGRPLVLTELGFPSHANAVVKPYSWPSRRVPAAPKLQRLAYRALRGALARTPAPLGVYVWKYVTTLDSYERRSWPRGFLLYGKPAEHEIRRMFGR